MKADDNRIRYERAKQRMNELQQVNREHADKLALHEMDSKTPVEKEEMEGQGVEIVTLGSQFIVL